MAQGDVARRLAAIVSADVVGYSRLMAEDEQATLVALKAHRDELIDPAIARHSGRIVKLMGDGILIEFSSVVDAVRTSVEIQLGMRHRNLVVSEQRRLQFRVGINQGEVVIDGDDIYGDGVNVAARLQEVAEPGGISISDRVYSDVRGKLEIGFEDLGERKLKNIPEPLRVFNVLVEGASSGLTPSPPSPRSFLAWTVMATVVLIVAISGGYWWWQPWVERVAPVDAEKMALPLPDKPSIAVLPFKNMSGDPEQAYFADGMAEDIITDLSKLSGLFVIARNSSFQYRGDGVDVKMVGRELGVKYVLEGSVRRAGVQVRINAQLIDTQSGGHLWAERYDGKFANVFSLQDQITARIVEALSLKLGVEEKARLADHGTTNSKAHDAFNKGWQHLQRETLEGFVAAQPHLEEAVALDPGYSRAHAALAWLYFASSYGERGWFPRLGLLLGSDAVEKGNFHLQLALQKPSAYAHAIKAHILLRGGQSAESLVEFEQALRLNPNDADALIYFADALYWLERPGEGLAHAARAMRLNPNPPAVYFSVLGRVRFGAEDYSGSARALEQAIARNPNDWRSYYFLVASLGYLGRKDDAAAVIRRHDEDILPVLQETEPDLPRLMITSWSYWSRMSPALNDQLLEGLKLAGVQ